MKYFIIYILLVLTSCIYNAKQIYPSPSQLDTYNALSIILDEFEKNNIYTKKEMLDVLNNFKLIKHRKCKSKNHEMNIVFKTGQWSEEMQRYCLYSENLEPNKCFNGLFDGKHTISMINKNKIHKTSFAHEVFHYFRKYIDGVSPKTHEPKQLWKDYVGYKDNNIGIINEALKEKGF